MSGTEQKGRAPSDFGPTASLAVLRLRSELLKAVRAFFYASGYWEVETPVLSHESIIDAHLEPFRVSTAEGEELYLQTSPELGMKRLLAAGANAVFQVTRAFRAGERGDKHNPEFTMVEWYRVGDTYVEQMDFTERLVRAVVLDVAACPWFEAASFGRTSEQCRAYFEQPFERLCYDEAFQRWAGQSVLGCDASELAELARRHGVHVPPDLGDDVDTWLNVLLVELVEPHLGRERPTFLFDYPACQSLLATVSAGPPAVAHRFELYLFGLEICNGYNELVDAAEVEARLKEQRARRLSAGRPTPPLPVRFLEAHRAGLPPCSGVALGLDRLLQALVGAARVDQVLAFPFERA